MLFEERVEAAERRRKEGNALFQQRKIADALGKYSMSLSYMDQDFMFQLQVAHRVQHHPKESHGYNQTKWNGPANTHR